jgi:glucose/arabinose dehydrogenase
MLKRLPELILLLFSVISLPAAALQETSISTTAYQLTPVVKELPLSWAISVSPTNALFITHRNGNISRIEQELSSAGELKYTMVIIALVPEDLLTGGQGGLLDIIFHPDYLDNGWIYLSYSAGTNSKNALKIVRFQLIDNKVTQLQSIFEVVNKKDTPVHYGGRLAFADNSALLVSTGDGFDYREKAQVKDNQLGKILRMTDTGKAHPENPFYGDGKSPAAYVFSLGHRNPQGLLVTQNQTIIAHEHGPDGGDEINFITPGTNYGWPVITQGKDYIGAVISPFTVYPGMQQPDLDWTPSIAPSGMTFYTQPEVAGLQYHLLVTSLKFKQIYAVPYQADDQRNVLGEAMVLLSKPDTRLRDIESDLRGNIWVLGDGEPAVLFQLQAK